MEIKKHINQPEKTTQEKKITQNRVSQHFKTSLIYPETLIYYSMFQKMRGVLLSIPDAHWLGTKVSLFLANVQCFERFPGSFAGDLLHKNMPHGET